MRLRAPVVLLIVLCFCLAFSSCKKEEKKTTVKMADGRVVDAATALTYDGGGIYNYGGTFMISANFFRDMNAVVEFGTTVHYMKLFEDLEKYRVASISGNESAVLALHLCRPPVRQDGKAHLTVDIEMSDPFGKQVLALKGAALWPEKDAAGEDDCQLAETPVQVKGSSVYPDGDFKVSLTIHDHVKGAAIPISRKLPFSKNQPE